MRPLALAFLLAGCATGQTPQPWTVAGTASSEEARQALALVDAAQVVYPDVPLKTWGRRIFLAPEIGGLCYGLPAPSGISGCADPGNVYIRWPHGACADLTCSALPHELSHLGMQGNGTEAQADAGALLIVLEYRRGVP